MEREKKNSWRNVEQRLSEPAITPIAQKRRHFVLRKRLIETSKKVEAKKPKVRAASLLPSIDKLNILETLDLTQKLEKKK